MDPVDSCLRMRCECDLQLARKLAEHEDEWNVDHHRRWGDNPFNAQESCRSGPGLIIFQFLAITFNILRILMEHIHLKNSVECQLKILIF